MGRLSAATAARRKRSNRRKSAIRKRYTKTELHEEIAANTGLGRKETAAVLDELGSIIERHVRKRAAGEFILPGLLKITTVKKAARPARKNVPNPFKPGERMDVPRKPASTRVRVTPLKKLKDFAL